MPEKLKEEEKRILKILPSLLKRDVWFRREEWKAQDKDDFVFGYPHEVQIDLLLKDKEHYLVEIKSSGWGSGDVTLLYRKAKFYTQITGVSPKMIFVSVDMSNEGRAACQELNIQLITYDDLKD